MADETPRPRGAGAKGLLAWVVILGLIGVVAWLAAERNGRTWYLVPDGSRLVVMKGMQLPVGRRDFTTSDPGLATAYAPLAPPPGKALPPEQTFGERSLLDQGIFDLLAAWARDEIASGEPARLERGLGYLARAERLAGISSAQRDELLALRAESGYHEAGRLLEGAARDLRDAAEKLRLAAGSRSAHAVDAQLLLKQVEPAVDATLGALRASSRGGAAARPVPAPAPAAPAVVGELPPPALSPVKPQGDAGK